MDRSVSALGLARRVTFCAPLALTLALAATPADAQAAKHGLTPMELATMDRASDAHVSPDGRLLAFDVRTVDYANNKATHSLWVKEIDGKGDGHRLAISDGGASTPRWSADGKSLYFMSGRSGSQQVWKTDAAGTQVTQVTALPLDVGSFNLAPDGTHIVVSMAVFPGTETGDKPAKPADIAKSTGVVFDKVFVRHWDEWADGTRNHLFALALNGEGVAAGAPVPLMKGFDGDAPGKPFGDDSEITISPDGKTVVFTARLAGRTEPWSTNLDLWQVPMDGSAAPANLTAGNAAMDTGPVFSPDGSKLAWRAMKRPTFEADRFGIMVRDLKSGETREIDPNWDRSADTLAWTADGLTLLTTAYDVGQSKLFSVDVKSGAVKALTGEGHVTAIDLVKGGDKGVVYMADSLSGPSQAYKVSLKGGKAEQLTHVGAETLAAVTLGAYEQFSFPGWNNEAVHGYVVKPANYQEGHKYPVAFIIHGGPQGSFGNAWSFRWNPQAYTGAGYAVVMIDFHGSTGYGQAFTDAISQHWGDRPLEDLQKGWAAALAKYPFLNGDRACALGASYGGFMINWIAGNWNGPWKCLVNHDGVFDNRMMGYSTEELWFSEWENGGKVWENPAGYERFNPANHVDQWTKPQLIIHGGRDFRIPFEQGLGAFTALQRKGVPSKLVYFADENHWVLKPQNSVQWHQEVLGWLNTWTAEAK
ncbi:S9 family peptidase [Nitrospirillum pindoramense]|uniref:Acylaminoacyl-peptidase n=1 Tax=Nitrospirillum amazonense TaxID=28077 RepID=A0A560H095_9PROT|nr:S9 family peptidase [Nitrospirillum amazonense]TWB39716.1 acylaminoacyl-peptidase [Nitrospirillum amazonense]